MWYLSTNISSGQTNCSVLASGAHTSLVDLVGIECFLLTRRENRRKGRKKERKPDCANLVTRLNKWGHCVAQTLQSAWCSRHEDFSSIGAHFKVIALYYFFIVYAFFIRYSAGAVHACCCGQK